MISKQSTEISKQPADRIFDYYLDAFENETEVEAMFLSEVDTDMKPWVISKLELELISAIAESGYKPERFLNPENPKSKLAQFAEFAVGSLSVNDLTPELINHLRPQIRSAVITVLGSEEGLKSPETEKILETYLKDKHSDVRHRAELLMPAASSFRKPEDVSFFNLSPFEQISLYTRGVDVEEPLGILRKFLKDELNKPRPGAYKDTNKTIQGVWLTDETLDRDVILPAIREVMRREKSVVFKRNEIKQFKQTFDELTPKYYNAVILAKSHEELKSEIDKLYGPESNFDIHTIQEDALRRTYYVDYLTPDLPKPHDDAFDVFIQNGGFNDIVIKATTNQTLLSHFLVGYSEGTTIEAIQKIKDLDVLRQAAEHYKDNNKIVKEIEKQIEAEQKPHFTNGDLSTLDIRIADLESEVKAVKAYIRDYDDPISRSVSSLLFKKHHEDIKIDTKNPIRSCGVVYDGENPIRSRGVVYDGENPIRSRGVVYDGENPIRSRGVPYGCGFPQITIQKPAIDDKIFDDFANNLDDLSEDKELRGPTR